MNNAVMQQQDVQSVLAKLAKLEKENRRLKFAAFLCVVFFAVAVFSAAKSPDTIVAEKFVLVDGTGKERAMLGPEDDAEAILRIYDNSGNKRIGLGIWKNGQVGLALSDEKSIRAGLKIFPNGENRLDFYDTAGVSRCMLGSFSTGAAGLGIWDSTEERAFIGVFNDNSSGLHLRQNGKTLLEALDASDGPQIKLYDTNGTERAGLQVWQQDPYLQFFDREGKRRIKLSSELNETQLSLWDPNGTARAWMHVLNGSSQLWLANPSGVSVWGYSTQ